MESVKGTNCFNCKWVGKKEPVDSDDLNDQGGIETTDPKELRLSAKCDLVTLPGKENIDEKAMCKHPQVKQWVTEHMCCAFWDAPGVHRAFGKIQIDKPQKPQQKQEDTGVAKVMAS